MPNKRSQPQKLHIRLFYFNAILKIATLQCKRTCQPSPGVEVGDSAKEGQHKEKGEVMEFFCILTETVVSQTYICAEISRTISKRGQFYCIERYKNKI